MATGLSGSEYDFRFFGTSSSFCSAVSGMFKLGIYWGRFLGEAEIA